MTTSTVEHPSVCPLDCPDTCSLTVTVEAGRITKIRGSRANPYTAGVLCAKVPESYPEFVHGPGRLTTPLRRTGAFAKAGNQNTRSYKKFPVWNVAAIASNLTRPLDALSRRR